MDRENIQIVDENTGEINFDVVVELHKNDPEKLEKLQKEIVEDYINSVPERNKNRLRGIQFKIDSIRKLSQNSTQSYLKIADMFWSEGFTRFNDILNGEHDLNVNEENIVQFAPVKTVGSQKESAR